MMNSPESSHVASARETLESIMNDQKGEIWLVTTDGARLRMRAYVLCAHSTVFRDMLAMSQGNKNNTEENPIPLAALKEEFASLLAFTTLDDVEHFSCWATMGRAYELSEMYDFPAVQGRLNDRIKLKKYSAPWGTFVFAAQQGMLTLARAALSKMHREENSPVTRAYEIPEQEAGRLSSGYMISYMLFLVKVPHIADHADWWASAVRTFEPRV